MFFERNGRKRNKIIYLLKQEKIRNLIVVVFFF